VGANDNNGGKKRTPGMNLVKKSNSTQPKANTGEELEAQQACKEKESPRLQVRGTSCKKSE